MNADQSTITRRQALLATSDPVFGALCKSALELGGDMRVLAVVHPTDLLDGLRRFAPEVVVLDADGHEVSAVTTLGSKVALVSDARTILVSSYLSPGSQGLSSLLQGIVAVYVRKPSGSSSLTLAGDDGPSFAVAIREALAGHDGEAFATDEQEESRHVAELRVSQLDEGWDLEQDRIEPLPQQVDP